MNTEPRKFRRLAFSAVELLVVCAVIGILAVLLIINMTASRKRAQDSNRKSSMASYRTAIEQYRSDRGTYFIYSLKLGGCPGGGNVKCTDDDVGPTAAINTVTEVNSLQTAGDYLSCNIASAPGCVGYKGGSWGRFTRRYDTSHTPQNKDAFLSFYEPNSIADALLLDGYMSENKTVPGMMNFYDGIPGNALDADTYLANSNDFYYTICSEAGTPATKPSQATRYGLFAQLNNADNLEKASAGKACGGPDTPALYPLR